MDIAQQKQSTGGRILGGAAGGAMGLISGAISTNQNKKAQERQHRMNEESADNAKKRALEMWKETGVDAQRKEMQKAGLNIGLMTGGGAGGAGGTTQAGSGMGVGAGGSGSGDYNMTGGAGMGMLMSAQIENIKAQTNKTNVEAENIGGAQKDNLQAGTENKKADTALKQMQTANQEITNNRDARSLEDMLETVNANKMKAIADAGLSIVGANVAGSTQNAQIKKIESEAVNEAFKLTLMKADKNLTEEKTRAIGVELAQEWESLSLELDKIGIQNMSNKIQEFTAKVNARLGQGNLDMRRIEAGLNATAKMLGGNKTPQKK